jgi:hypothetical protein
MAHYYRPTTDSTRMKSVLLTKYNTKQGIQHFGEKGMEALITELRQIRRVVEHINVTALYDKEIFVK